MPLSDDPIINYRVSDPSDQKDLMILSGTGFILFRIDNFTGDNPSFSYPRIYRLSPPPFYNTRPCQSRATAIGIWLRIYRKIAEKLLNK